MPGARANMRYLLASPTGNEWWCRRCRLYIDKKAVSQEPTTKEFFHVLVIQPQVGEKTAHLEKHLVAKRKHVKRAG